jgi:hypothetical protein
MCERIYRNRCGLNVHQRTCLNKIIKGTHNEAVRTTRDQILTARGVKITELLSKNNQNGICVSK